MTLSNLQKKDWVKGAFDIFDYDHDQLPNGKFDIIISLFSFSIVIIFLSLSELDFSNVALINLPATYTMFLIFPLICLKHYNLDLSETYLYR